MTGTEICKGLESGQTDIATFVKSLDDEVFFKGSDEHWSPAHHVAHLTFTHKRVTRGFKAKDRLEGYAAEPKTYEEVINNYLMALQKAASAGFLRNNPFAAKPESDDKNKEIAKFLQATQELCEAIHDWSEAELDTKGMQHPLLGLLSAREILFFMIYHDQHHLQGVQKLVKV
jgi:DinB superfamily